ncbi:MAG TPA: hypothetical protein VGP46_10930, partial [Acidimicrobiales bacterium]|nr:hypothetical protein [Acidimicrobiales bacterium]
MTRPRALFELFTSASDECRPAIVSTQHVKACDRAHVSLATLSDSWNTASPQELVLVRMPFRQECLLHRLLSVDLHAARAICIDSDMPQH